VGGHWCTDAGTRDGHRHQKPPDAGRAFGRRQRYVTSIGDTRKGNEARVSSRAPRRRHDTLPRNDQVVTEEFSGDDDANQYDDVNHDDHVDNYYDDDNDSGEHGGGGVAASHRGFTVERRRRLRKWESVGRKRRRKYFGIVRRRQLT
jgi:hypothetical protein